MLTAAAAEHSPPTCTAIIVEHQKQCAHHLPASFVCPSPQSSSRNWTLALPPRYVCSWVRDLLRLSTLQEQRGAAENGSGLALADPHTRTKQDVWTAPTVRRRRTERRVWVFGSPHRRELSNYSKAAKTAGCGSSYQTSTPELSCQNSDSDPSPSSWYGSLISVLVKTGEKWYLILICEE